MARSVVVVRPLALTTVRYSQKLTGTTRRDAEHVKEEHYVEIVMSQPRVFSDIGTLTTLHANPRIDTSRAKDAIAINGLHRKVSVVVHRD